MPTFIGHGFSGLAISALIPRKASSGRAALLCAVCAVAPDIDSIGFRLGIPYQHWLGHRGFTHSILFAALLALGASCLVTKKEESPGTRLFLWSAFFLSALLHGVLDALTNGGLGVAFFSPFSTARFFLPWHPIEVSPISPVRFLSARGTQVLASEFLWVIAPSLAVIALSWSLRRTARRKGTGSSVPSRMQD